MRLGVVVQSMVYNLVMIDMEASYDNHTEAFNIGFFSSHSKMQQKLQRYI